MIPKDVLNPPRESKSAIIYETEYEQENLLITHTQDELSIGVHHLGAGISIIAFFPEPVDVHNLLEEPQEPTVMAIPSPVAKDTADALLSQWALNQLPLDTSEPQPPIDFRLGIQINNFDKLCQPQILNSKGKPVSLSKQAEIADGFFRIENQGKYFSVNKLLDIIAA